MGKYPRAGFLNMPRMRVLEGGSMEDAPCRARWACKIEGDGKKGKWSRFRTISAR